MRRIAAAVLALAFAIPAFAAEPEKAMTIFVSPTAKTFFVSWDPAKWTGDKSCPKDAELCLKHRELPTSVVVGAGREEIPPFRLHEFATSLATAGMANGKIVSEQRKKVNDTEVLAVRGEGLMDEGKLTTYGYYFAGKQGYVVIISYTPTASFADCEHAITEMLDGLNIVKPAETP
jgi:hypothetical protein